MIQDQQSPRFFNHPQKYLGESSFFRQYLPQNKYESAHSLSSEESILCTPQNYMLVLSYSTSLEKENVQLREEILLLKDKVKQLTNKNNQTETIMRQIKHETISSRPSFNSNNPTHNNAPLLNSFSMINRNQQFQRSNAKPIDEEGSDFHTFFEKQLILMLKNENTALNERIEKLYSENERLLTLKIHAYDRKAVKKPDQTNDRPSPFTKINLLEGKENKHIQSNKMSFNRIVQPSYQLPYQELNQKLQILHKNLKESRPVLQPVQESQSQSEHLPFHTFLKF